MSPQLPFTDEEIISRISLDRLLPDICLAIASSKVVKKFTEKYGISTSVEELQVAADEFRNQMGLTRAADTIKWLENYGMSVDDFEKVIDEQVLNKRLAEYLFADKVEPFFYQNQLDFSGAYLSEILVTDRDLANEIFLAIREEEISFTDAARQYTNDVELGRKGGYLGFIKRRDMSPEISGAVFASKTGEILPPIATKQGFHMIAIEEISPPVLTSQLRNDILQNMYAEWLRSQAIEFLRS
jgi:parvulin-like peptidyl-prolyl isomerase